MKRVQRKRTKGFKLPENTVCINRGTKWGNPLKLVGDAIYIDAGYRRKILDKWVLWGHGNDIEDLIFLYKRLWDDIEWLNFDLQYWSDEFKELDLTELKDKNLACFCGLEKKCHADVLLKLANGL